jgi:SAM-dependent methyltransferase
VLIDTVRGRCPHCGPDFVREPCARGEDYEYRTTGAREFTFVRCQSCRTIVLDPRPSDATIPSLYPESYEPYRFSELPALVRWGRELVQYRKVRALLEWTPEGGTVVDVGCGSGSTLQLVRKFGAKNLKLVGWDFPGPHMEHLARAGFETIAAPIVAENAPQNVDVFIMNQVIEHFAEPDALIAGLRTALRPGGVLFIETPDTEGLDAKWFGKGFWGGYHIPRHMVLFDREGLVRLLDDNGFKTVEAASLPSPAFWIQSLHHLAETRRHRKLARLCTIRNLGLVGAFTAFDMMLGKFRPTSNQRVIAVRADN